MKKDVRKIAVDYILQNTSEANIKKAVSGFDIQSIIEPQKEWLLRNIFFGDGIKYSQSVNHIFDDYINLDGLTDATAILADMKDQNRRMGQIKDKAEGKEIIAEIENSNKEIKPYVSKLKKLLTYHNKINQK